MVEYSQYDSGVEFWKWNTRVYSLGIFHGFGPPYLSESSVLFAHFQYYIYIHIHLTAFGQAQILIVFPLLFPSLLMFFSELCCEKTRPSQLKISCSADYQQPSMSNSDFGELVWENGQVVVKGGQDTKASGHDDADFIPWFYHVDDMLHHESTSGFLAETSGVTSNDFPRYTNISAAHQLSNLVKDSALVALDSKNGLSLPSSGSRVSNVAVNGSVCKYAIESDSLEDQLSELKLQKDPDDQYATNFIFSRSLAGAKNDPDSVGARANDRLLTHETAAAAKDGMLVETNGQTIDETMKCLPSGPVEKQANPIRCEDGLKLNQVICANAHIEYMDADKIREPAAAPHSVCSDNSGMRASNNPTYHLKRKHSDEEDCEYSSEDAEEESTSIRKAVCKRNRDAEVHNLTERKRREKINDKMRALQELVPNCNKVDKATMLDEAIEYLRVLQFQVQMMSMRSQMCTPHIMPQPGLQHLQALAHMPQFMPMGIAMGMGYQAGALDTPPWIAVQGLPVSVPGLTGLSAPMPGSPHTLIPGSAVTPMAAAETPKSKNPHLG